MSARIVVCDDEADIRRLIVFSLRRRGFEVSEASAGDSGLALIRAELPDLVVLDVMMPGIDGIEVARQLRADPATAAIPIIMLSAKGQDREIAAGIAGGACAYLIKPFEPRMLLEEVNMALQASRGNGAAG